MDQMHIKKIQCHALVFITVSLFHYSLQLLFFYYAKAAQIYTNYKHRSTYKTDKTGKST